MRDPAKAGSRSEVPNDRRFEARQRFVSGEGPTMPLPSFAPVLVEQAFSAHQVSELRAAMDACRPFMSDLQNRANSIGFDQLRRRNEPAPLTAVIGAFLNSGAHDFAAEQFPDGYCFLLWNCSFRYHDPASTKSHLEMHFDASFLGLGGKVYNVWVPLDDLGNGVPGLTFLSPEADPLKLYRVWRAKYDARTAKHGPGAAVDIFFDRRMVERIYENLGDGAFVSPRIKAGGFIAFHQLVAHSTEVVQKAPKPRGSLEFRIAGIRALPDVYRKRDLWAAVVQIDDAGRRSVRIVETSELAAEAGAHTA
ncbi:hypothetical protein [Thalassobaculum sp.]|uniref:hypothetical protein n=1 Tax=Thalassobaculum sp. TaxID=2022740 RepID=UPI0032ED6890